MRTFSALFAVAGATLLACSATAQTAAPAPDTARVEVTSVAPRYPIHFDDVRAVRGTYALSNGWTLRVQPKSRTIVAQIDDGAPMQLVALSPDKFETPDHATTMTFNQGADRQDMTMSYLLPDRTVMVIGTGNTLAGR